MVLTAQTTPDVSFASFKTSKRRSDLNRIGNISWYINTKNKKDSRRDDKPLRKEQAL
jgi:hypothetical protein